MSNNDKGLSIGLLIALVAFPQISETIYTPALPNVAKSLMTSASMVETTLAIYFLGFAFGILMWGTISDYFGRRKAMLAGIVVYGLATFGCATSSTIEMLLAWRLIQAFGASVGSVITQTILRDAYTGADRAKLFSVVSGAIAFSPAIGPLLGGIVSDFFGWQANFWLLTTLSIGLFSWAFCNLKETRPAHIKRLSKNSLKNLFFAMMRDHRLWGHILLIACCNAIIFGFYQEAPFVFIERLGMEPKYYGCFGLLIAAATVIAARTSFCKSATLSAHTLIKWGSASALVGSILFFLTALSGILVVKTGFLIALLSLFLTFFGIGLIIPNSLTLALKQYQAAAGSAGSIFGGCYYSFVALLTWLMSALHNGTELPLTGYILALGIVILVAARWLVTEACENSLLPDQITIDR